ncbi:RNA polymerase sigma factor [Kineococcus xinjiangensis]|nr:RNA polymerase sigma factor [Kineococcus xinjiangensis]
MHALVEAHGRDLLAYLERRTSPVEDAADLLSETLLTAWRRVGDLPGEDEAARMWLFVTARNVLANHRRAQQRRTSLTERLRTALVEHHRNLPTVHGAAEEAAEAVREAIAALPEAQRELVTLVHWDGFSLTEAATLTAVPASTARSRYAKARATLATELGTRRLGTRSSDDSLATR